MNSVARGEAKVIHFSNLLQARRGEITPRFDIAGAMKTLTDAVASLPAAPEPVVPHPRDTPEFRPKAAELLKRGVSERLQASEPYKRALADHQAYLKRVKAYEAGLESIQNVIDACVTELQPTLAALLHERVSEWDLGKEGAQRLEEFLGWRRQLLACRSGAEQKMPTLLQRVIDLLERQRRELPDLASARSHIVLLSEIAKLKFGDSAVGNPICESERVTRTLQTIDPSDAVGLELGDCYTRALMAPDEDTFIDARLQAAREAIEWQQDILDSALCQATESALNRHGEASPETFDLEDPGEVELMLEVLREGNALLARIKQRVAERREERRTSRDFEDVGAQYLAEQEDILGDNYHHYIDGQYGSGGNW